jgi:ABC-type branched-subunit amino acid transport system permease subunit
MTFEALIAPFIHLDFWIGVAVIAGIYGIFTLGLQINIGFTGMLNFGQAGFMLIGAYTMGLLVTDHGWSMWASLPVAMLASIVAGLVVGLPSLRLRADYFAIATIAFAEIVRYVTQNSGWTGGNQGVLGYDNEWRDVLDWALPVLDGIGLGKQIQAPLLIFVWVTFVLLILLLGSIQRTPWGRVLRAIREDEDAARALGKNVFVYKLQSLSIAAALGAIAGYFFALDVTFLYPSEFEPMLTFFGYAILVLGGFGSYWGVAFGAVLLWTLLEGTRLIDWPLTPEQVASLRFIIVGLLLILITALRPQGVFGKRQEMLLNK